MALRFFICRRFNIGSKEAITYAALTSSISYLLIEGGERKQNGKR